MNMLTQLRSSVALAERLNQSNRALKEVTAELRRVLAENEFLSAQLHIANLKLERRHLRIVASGTPAFHRPQI